MSGLISLYRLSFFADDKSAKSIPKKVFPSYQPRVSILKPFKYFPNVWSNTRDKSSTFLERLQELTLEKMKHKPAPLSKKIIKELDRMQSTWK